MSREQLFTVWQNRNSRVSRKPVKPQVQHWQKETLRILNLGTALGGSWGLWCEFRIWAGSWTLKYRDPSSCISSWKRDCTSGARGWPSCLLYLPLKDVLKGMATNRTDFHWNHIHPRDSSPLWLSTTAALQAIQYVFFLYSWHTQGTWSVDQSSKGQGLHPGIACMPGGTSEKPCSNLTFCAWWKVRMHCLDNGCTWKAT